METGYLEGMETWAGPAPVGFVFLKNALRVNSESQVSENTTRHWLSSSNWSTQGILYRGGCASRLSEDKEKQGFVSGQHEVLDGAFHRAHLLRGGGQEGQGPDALLHTGVAEVPTLVFLPVAISDGELPHGEHGVHGDGIVALPHTAANHSCFQNVTCQFCLQEVLPSQSQNVLQ